jgi:hypothetical protein
LPDGLGQRLPAGRCPSASPSCASVPRFGSGWLHARAFDQEVSAGRSDDGHDANEQLDVDDPRPPERVDRFQVAPRMNKGHTAMPAALSAGSDLPARRAQPRRSPQKVRQQPSMAIYDRQAFACIEVG